MAQARIRALTEDAFQEGGYPSSEEIAQHKLMDAGVRCLDEYGLQQTSITRIAKIAGTARQTVYKYFRGKEELLAAAFQREGVKLGMLARQHIRQFDDVETKFIEAFVFVVREFPKNPVLNRVKDLAFFPVGSTYIDPGALGELVFEDIFAARPDLKKRSAGISEYWIRGVVSFITILDIGAHRTDTQRKRFVKDYFLPGIRL